MQHGRVAHRHRRRRPDELRVDRVRHRIVLERHVPPNVIYNKQRQTSTLMTQTQRLAVVAPAAGFNALVTTAKDKQTPLSINMHRAIMGDFLTAI